MITTETITRIDDLCPTSIISPDRSLIRRYEGRDPIVLIIDSWMGTRFAERTGSHSEYRTRHYILEKHNPNTGLMRTGWEQKVGVMRFKGSVRTEPAGFNNDVRQESTNRSTNGIL